MVIPMDLESPVLALRILGMWKDAETIWKQLTHFDKEHLNY